MWLSRYVLALLLPLVWFSQGMAGDQVPQPMRLFYKGNTGKAEECEIHPGAGSSGKPKAAGKPAAYPRALYESEHRPTPKRIYFLSDYRRRAQLSAYVRRADGVVFTPELRLGFNPNVSYTTPFGDGPFHGPNNVYVVEQGVENETLYVRTAQWITMHHSCGWGHDAKFDEKLTTPQAINTIPMEIVVDKMWDGNFHLALQSGDKLGLTILSRGKPVTGAQVVIRSEKGWEIKTVTDDNGKVSVQMIRDYYPPLWQLFKRTHRGEVLITASHSFHQQGIFKDKPFSSIHHQTTLPWMYTPSKRDYTSYSYGLSLVMIGSTLSGLGMFFYRERRKKPYKEISLNE